MTLDRELLTTARHLARARPKNKPRQADLRRAISTAYYGLFHALAKECADRFVGTNEANRSDQAWKQTYRALDHGYAKNQCDRARNKGFPPPIVRFGNTFKELQEERHRSDYDPTARFTRAEALLHVDAAERGIKDLRRADKTDRSAFAAWVLLKER